MFNLYPLAFPRPRFRTWCLASLIWTFDGNSQHSNSGKFLSKPNKSWSVKWKTGKLKKWKSGKIGEKAQESQIKHLDHKKLIPYSRIGRYGRSNSLEVQNIRKVWTICLNKFPGHVFGLGAVHDVTIVISFLRIVVLEFSQSRCKSHIYRKMFTKFN